jgi:hypothetical protein
MEKIDSKFDFFLKSIGTIFVSIFKSYAIKIDIIHVIFSKN